MPLLSGLSTGAKQDTRLSARAISMVRWAAKESSPDSHCSGCGARIAAKIDAADYHVAYHLAGDASGRCHPGDCLAGAAGRVMLLHQPIDALGVDRGKAVGSAFALEERGDPASHRSVARRTSTDQTCNPNIAGTVLAVCAEVWLRRGVRSGSSAPRPVCC